ncbi:MAG: lysophospholipid acyltransferase family protein [Balneolales bacterium]
MPVKNGLFIKLRMIVTMLWVMILMPALTAVTIILTLLSFGKLRNFLVTWIGYILGRSSLAVAGVRVKICYHDKKPTGPAIFLINHSSTLDILVVLSIFLPRVRYIAKREIQYNPFFLLLVKFLGQIMINRKDSRSTLEQLQNAYTHIRENRLSMMFAPEGTRSKTGEIGPFKSGAFHTAIELGYPIVPVYFEGAYKLCPGNALVTLPGTVTVHFHPPIDTSGWDKKNIRQHREKVRNMYLKWKSEEQASV